MRHLFPLAAILLTTSAAAQKSAPQPVPFENRIPVARDVDFPGMMTLKVDATDVRQGIFRVKQTIPVTAPGPMVLLSPSWLPGVHAPAGQIEKLTGLKIRAGGALVPWTRDTVDMWAFHIDVPRGARQLDIEFQFT